MKTILYSLICLGMIGFETSANGTISLDVIQANENKLLLHENVSSLDAAVEKARQFPTDTQRTIRLSQGRYFLDKTLTLDQRDSGLTIAAEPNTRPVLIGGRVLTGWKQESQHLWSVDLPQLRQGQWEFRFLVVNGKSAKRARLPQTGYFQNLNKWTVPWLSTTAGGWKRKPTKEELITMRYDPKDLGPWLNIHNAELTVYHMWDESMVGIAAMDDKTHTITFSNPATHPPGAFRVNNYVVWNVRQGLTGPGQWFLDKENGKVVYWPLDGEELTTADVIAPTVECIIRVAGTWKKPVREITLEGLTLSVTNAPLKSGGFGAGKFDGALQLAFAHDSRISNLTILNVAGQGIKDKASQQLTIENCHIFQTGACGIWFNGGTKRVQNNHIHDIGLLFPSAIGLRGGGNRGKLKNDNQPGHLIVHNTVHDVPYSAITCNGSNHRIESNLVYHAMQQLHDGAGIYVSGGKNITVCGNFIRDIADTGGYGSSAIYLDEGSQNVLVEDNLTVNVPRPSHNHMAKNNIIRNNVFIHNGDMRITFPKSAAYTMDHNILQADGSIRLSTSYDRAPEQVGYTPKAFAKLENNIFFSRSGNLIGIKKEGNRTTDPGMVYDGNGKVIFSEGSLAEKMGFKTLDVSTAGAQ